MSSSLEQIQEGLGDLANTFQFMFGIIMINMDNNLHFLNIYQCNKEVNNG